MGNFLLEQYIAFVSLLLQHFQIRTTLETNFDVKKLQTEFQY